MEQMTDIFTHSTTILDVDLLIHRQATQGEAGWCALIPSLHPLNQIKYRAVMDFFFNI